MKSTGSKPGWLRRFVGWLFGAPFRELPAEFGDTVPSELEVFEAQAEEAQHHPVGVVTPVSTGDGEKRSPHS